MMFCSIPLLRFHAVLPAMQAIPEDMVADAHNPHLIYVTDSKQRAIWTVQLNTGACVCVCVYGVAWGCSAMAQRGVPAAVANTSGASGEYHYWHSSGGYHWYIDLAGQLAAGRQSAGQQPQTFVMGPVAWMVMI